MASAHQLQESESVAISPALALVYEGINELVQEGWATWEGLALPVVATDRVIYAVSRSDKDVIGALCFRVDSVSRIARVTLGYVEPSSRKQGVFRSLWDALLDHVRKNQLTIVVGGVHTENNVAQTVLQKFRGTVTAVTFEFRSG